MTWSQVPLSLATQADSRPQLAILSCWTKYGCAFQVPRVSQVVAKLSVKNLLRSFLPEVGLEPTSLAAHDFESCVYTIPPLRRLYQDIFEGLIPKTILSPIFYFFNLLYNTCINKEI